MAIEQISISIYDTTLPAVGGPEPINWSERGDIKIIYEGGDDKYFSLFPSRVTFSLEVPHDASATDLYYEELFTGNEFKYKVVVADENDVMLWVGYLLPDEYSEPYTTGTFYVKFTATDGIGKLKGKILNTPDYLPKLPFFAARHSVTKAIADCLKETALELEIWIDPAIENEGAGKRWDKIYLDGSVWMEKDKPENCNTILEDIITEMGCVLFQQYGRWYIIGINNRAKTSATFYKYDKDGVFIATSLDDTSGIYLDFNASPEVRINPPLKEVTTILGIDENPSVLRADIVKQPWVKFEEPGLSPWSRYWDGTGLQPLLEHEALGDWPEYTTQNLDLTAYVASDIVYAAPSYAQILANYISLIAPVYISGGNGETLDLYFEHISFWGLSYEGQSVVDRVDNDIVVFDILLNGTTIASNKQAFASRGSFFLEFSETNLETLKAKVTAKLDFKGLEITENGFLDIRFHHIGKPLQVTTDKFLVLDLKITLNETTGLDYIKRRAINFTKTNELEIKHGDSVLTTAKNSFLYQDIIPASEFTQAKVSEVLELDGFGWVFKFSTELDYDNVLANKDRIYVERYNSNFPEYIEDIVFISASPDFYVVVNFNDGHIPIVYDSILIRDLTPGTPQTAAVINYRVAWKKTTNDNGYQRYGDSLSEIKHDIYSEATLMIEGESKWLLFPLEALSFEFKNETRKWMPVRLEMAPGENTTRITALEYKNDKVADYE